MRRFLCEDLREWKNSSRRKPLILRGARQVGKTYLLKEFCKSNFKQVYYCNFEEQPQFAKVFHGSLSPSTLLQDIGLLLGKKIEVNNAILVFDEIQSCPQALTSLKYFSENLPELPVCSAGSLLGLELNHASFPVGKVDFLELYPLSFGEFLCATRNELLHEALLSFVQNNNLSQIAHDKLWEQFKRYLIVGGMPEAVKCYAEKLDSPVDAFSAAKKAHDSLLLSYEADIAKHSGENNSMHIQRLFRNVPEQLAKDVDGAASKFVFKEAIGGIRGYERLSGVIDWLETAGLIIRVPIVHKAALPFSAFAKENNFKLFLFDVGLLTSLSGLTPKVVMDYSFGSYKGYLAENAVASLLLTSKQHRLYSWKEKNSELEFLLSVDGEIVPIEVKSGRNVRARSLSVFMGKYAPKCSVVLSSKPPISNKQPSHLPLYCAEFLAEILKKMIN